MPVTEQAVAVPGAAFTEHYVEADGFRIRYKESGTGDALVALHGGGGLRISRAHEMLADQFRVIAFEVPGFGESPANERSNSMQELARTMLAAVAALGIEKFNLMGNSFGGRLAAWMAVEQPDVLSALVLVAPAAIRLPGGAAPPSGGSPESMAALMYAHPERQPPIAPPAPEIAAKQQALSRRVMGPPRDPALEDQFPGLNIPVLVLLGTSDKVVSPDVARIYREKLPNCNVVFVYDAAHAIDADRPEAVNSLVGDFLHRHERFLVNTESALINP